MNPAALFPPVGSLGGGAYEAIGMVDRQNEAMRQAVMQSQLGNLDIGRQQLALDEARQQVPVSAMQRQLALQQGQGALERMPFEQTRQTELARAGARPGRLASEIAAGDLELEEKQRVARWKKESDEMDIFARAYSGVAQAQDSNDPAGMTEQMKFAIDTMKKHGIDISKKDTDQLRAAYNAAVNGLPQIRTRIENYEKHKEALALQKLRNEGDLAEAQVRADALKEKPVTTPNAVLARIIEKYNTDPDSLTQEQREQYKSSIESTWIKNRDPDLETDLRTQARRETRAEDEEKGTKSVIGRADRELARYIQLRRKHFEGLFSTTYPKLYRRGEEPVPAPDKDKNRLKNKYGLE